MVGGAYLKQCYPMSHPEEYDGGCDYPEIALTHVYFERTFEDICGS